MNTVINIRASVFPNKGVSLSFEQRIQVSLDCSICGRTHRTVVFRLPGKPGVCTPTGHVFPGNVSPLSVIDKSGLFDHEVECSFLLTYEYSPVAERKYPQHVSSSLPTWARVHFKATCPRCQAVRCRTTSFARGPAFVIVAIRCTKKPKNFPHLSMRSPMANLPINWLINKHSLLIS